MRLKLLFFPLVLIVSIVVILNSIVPQWDELKVAKEKESELTKNMDDLNKKEANLKSLSEDIKRNDNKVKYVDKYLPKTGSEERIIDSINYFSSGLLLASIDLKKVEEEVIGVEEEVVSSGLFSGENGSQGESADDAKEIPVADFINGKISLIGPYESLMTFMNNLSNMQILNSIKSITISHVDSESDLIENIPTDVAEKNSEQDLVAEISVDFGSLSNAKVEDAENHHIFLKSEYDFSAINKLQQNISATVPDLNVSHESRSNPFLQ